MTSRRLKGTIAADILACDPLLSNTIHGGSGKDLLNGGSGSDPIDLSGIFYGQSVEIQHVARLTEAGLGTKISIDVGLKTGFVDPVLLETIHDLSVDDLSGTGSINL